MESLEKTCGEKENIIVRGYKSLSKYTNFKWNLLGALFGGASAYYFNSEHGLKVARESGIKQTAYAAIMAGVNIRLCQRLATEVKDKKWALISATVIPSVIAIGGSYLFHKITGTPDSFQSVYIPLATAPPFFWIQSWRYRKEVEVNLLENQNS